MKYLNIIPRMTGRIPRPLAGGVRGGLVNTGTEPGQSAQHFTSPPLIPPASGVEIRVVLTTIVSFFLLNAGIAHAADLLNRGSSNLLNPSGNKNLLNESGNKNLLNGDSPLCKSINVTSDADVAYKSGADANGNYVAPADVDGGSVNMMPKKINIPLTISLANALHLNTNAAPYNQLGAGTEAVIGTISVEGGRVTYNGQSLSNDQQNNLKAICKK